MTLPILVVDDERAVRDLVRRVLREAGYAVETAEEGGEALALLTATDGAARLVLTDLVMPVMHGFELVRAVRQRWPTMPCLYMTGFAEAIASDGPDPDCPLLTKPFGPAELERQVRALAGDP